MSRVGTVAQLAAPVAPVPVVWTLLGYPFEAGSMIAGLCACIAVRFYVAAISGVHKWTVDLPVSAITLMFTAGIIVHARPEPFWAMAYGTGTGALGATIITLCMGWVKRTTDVFAPPEPPRPPSDPAHASTAQHWTGMPQPTPDDMTDQLGRIP